MDHEAVPTSTSGRTRRPPARTSPTSTRRRTSGTTRTRSEPAAASTARVLAFLLDAYREEEAGPRSAATWVLDLSAGADEGCRFPHCHATRSSPRTRRVFDLVKSEWMDFDDAGRLATLPAAGRGRHAVRVTVDFDSLDDAQVTVRERDSMGQDCLPHRLRRPSDGAPAIAYLRRSSSG